MKAKIKLYRAPYVDEEGTGRERIQAIVIGAEDYSGTSDSEVQSFARTLNEALSEHRVLVFPDGDVEVEWL